MNENSNFLAVKDTFFSSKLQFNTQGILQTFNAPIVMGIINSTPDSFYEKSRVISEEEVLKKAEEMINAGATILDIGGYSSRPGANAINEAEEIERVEPLIYAIRKRFPKQLLSIDTFRSNVAKIALEAGASIVNDISGGQTDPKIFTIAATYQAPYILMHMRGTPQNMMNQTHYDNLIVEMMTYFSERIACARSYGVKDILIDPGFGFSKTTAQNFELLNKCEHFKQLDVPLLIGVSRKSMIYKTLSTTPDGSLNGTSVLNTIALLKGAQIIRVHDVKEAVETVKLVEALKATNNF